jgi:hypothetical protein
MEKSLKSIRKKLGFLENIDFYDAGKLVLETLISVIQWRKA